KNFIEDGLMDLIEIRNPNAVIFANKTLNRDRGYDEKIEVHHSGQVNHKHEFSIDQLNLDTETKRKVLNAIREQQKALEAPEQRQALPMGEVVEAEFVER